VPWTTANGVSLHFEIDGEGASAVFLHEIGGSLRSWDRVATKLNHAIRVLRYDQRGFGLSEKIRAPYTVETLVDDLQQLIATATLPPPFHVVSLAASAMQALELHRRIPEQVASLVFCNPAPGVDSSRAAALHAVADKAEHEGIRSILPM